MDIKSLKPARDYAIQFGFKGLVYGPPGGGKTPLVNTAPKPLLLACEPGLLSMRGSEVPTYFATDAKALDEFFKWFFNSTETKNFETIAIDSISEMAIIYLKEGEKLHRHGLQSYGHMAERVLEQLRGLYYTREKHTYLIAKEETQADGFKRPNFAGKVLSVDVPHMYDAILRLAIHNVPNVGQVKAFRCVGSMGELARNRTGNLDEFEQPNYSDLIRKALQ
jgi:AAA domain